MLKQCRKNEKGIIPIYVIVILSLCALVGTGVLGFLLGKGVQGFALTVAFTILIVIFMINAAGVVRWIKSVKKEARDI
jgi:TM2 domain-containing membrane protein YozV